MTTSWVPWMSSTGRSSFARTSRSSGNWERSQRVIGSLALASPVGASHPAMLAIAKQAARDLQDALLNTAPLELQALLARFADGTARHRVLAISRGGVLASTGALPMLSHRLPGLHG